jgi:hypothetical protein
MLTGDRLFVLSIRTTGLRVFCISGANSRQPLIVTEIVMGYQMVKWGAGVHQWQITLGQLFNQLYVG